jgi:hypothetical protein
MSDTTTGPDKRALVRWLFVLVWAVSVANALHYLDRGWFPHDLGSLAEPAARVLRGQWPQRDFVDVYTGGLAVLGALGFKLLGVSAMSLRWVLFAVFVVWVPAVWYIARRLATPAIAAAVTLLAGGWTLPIYAEGMPSWYNLFMATFGVAAFFRYLEVRRRHWLFVAGLAGGVSILFKVVGLYFVACGLLFLAYLEAFPTGTGAGPREEPGTAAGDTANRSPERSGEHAGDTAYRLLIVVGALVLSAMVVSMIVRAVGVSALFRFGVPGAVPALTLAAVVWRRGGLGGSVARFRRLFALLLPFLAGVLVPVVIFAIPYGAVGAMGDLYRGVFALPARRFALARWGGARGLDLGTSIALASVIWVGWVPFRRGVLGGVLKVVAAGLLVAALFAGGHLRPYVRLWETLWWLPPWVMLAGAVKIVTTDAPADHERRLFAVFAAFGLTSLVAVPFAAPPYFFFAAPLLALLGAGLVGRGPIRRQVWFGSVVAFLLLFTVLRLDPGFVRNLGFNPGRDVQTQVLDLPRSGGLKIDAAEKEEFETVVRMVDALAGGPYIYATPDCPEIYFLSGKWNPTPTLFEFLDPEGTGSPKQILDMLDRRGVRVVVINRNPLFSAPVSSELVAGLQTRYPMAREVGRFLVVWKAAGSP